jgi:YegS/Rv2252/BmrU family lipid kinase
VRTAVIVNPRSAGGKTGRIWPRIAKMLMERLGPVDTRFTEGQGHATPLARELLGQGYERIIAAGGDGTISEAANGFLCDDAPVRRGACLGIIPLGTGGDFRRTLGIPRDPAKALDLLATAAPLPIDVGKATFRGFDGALRTRYFINVLSFGMGGDVAGRARNLLSPLGGKAAFLYASACALLRYERKQVTLQLDGGNPPFSFSIYNVAVGNGRFHGGGMQACPAAVLNDGMFEVTVIEYMPALRVLLDFPALYSGNIYRHPKVRRLRGAAIDAESREPVRIEIDGEALGMLPLHISVLPQRLPVLAPRDYAERKGA